MIRQKVLKTPRALRLKDLNLVPTRYQFADNAAQKMRVAMVPAG
jgi:hypothetical protein